MIEAAKHLVRVYVVVILFYPRVPVLLDIRRWTVTVWNNLQADVHSCTSICSFRGDVELRLPHRV